MGGSPVKSKQEDDAKLQVQFAKLEREYNSRLPKKDSPRPAKRTPRPKPQSKEAIALVAGLKARSDAIEAQRGEQNKRYAELLRKQKKQMDELKARHAKELIRMSRKNSK